MQNLRHVVAQCFRGGRSIVNRQFYGFSSSPTNNNSMMGVAKKVYAITLFKSIDHFKLYREICEAEDRAAKLGKKVASEHYELNLFMPNKSTVVYYDDPNPKV